MGIKRTDAHHGNSRVRFRTSAIKEQVHKSHMVFYIQPSWDGDYAYCLPMSTLYEYFKLCKKSWKDSEWKLGIRVYDLLIKGEWEEFIDIPLKWDVPTSEYPTTYYTKEMVKVIRLC